jgi:hypothetical protein
MNNDPSLRLNWSANTDPQLQEAASPRMLRSGCLQRWAAQEATHHNQRAIS